MKDDTQITEDIAEAIVAIAESATDLWESNPELAARMAFVQVQCEWDSQAQAGLYGGRVPSYESLAAIRFNNTAAATAAATAQA